MKYVRYLILDYFYISDVTLEITAGTETRTVTQDNIFKRQEYNEALAEFYLIQNIMMRCQ